MEPMKKFNLVDLLAGLTNGLVQIIGVLKGLIVSVMNLAFPLLTVLIILEIVFKVNLGILANVIKALALVGISDNILTTIILVVFGAWFLNFVKK